MGMHRSGTSALTGVLNILGTYLGENMMQPSNDNKKGYFENNDIAALNNYLLKYKFNCDWDVLDELKIDKNNAYLKGAIEYIIEMVFVNNDSVIGIKDPKICLLLPLYQEALKELEYEIHYVRTSREKSEIVDSIMIRDGFTRKKCEKIVDIYLSSLDKHIPNALTISYDDLINKTDDVIDILQEHFPFLDYSDENKEKIKEFIDPNLKHN